MPLSQMDVSALFGECTIPAVKFGGRGIIVIGLFCRGWPRPFSSSEEKYYFFSIPKHFGQFYASSNFQTCGNSLGKVLFVPYTKQGGMVGRLGVEKPDWSTQNPDLNPINHVQGEPVRRPRARPSRPTSVSDLTKDLMDEWARQHLAEIFPRKVLAVRAARGDQLHLKFIFLILSLFLFWKANYPTHPLVLLYN